MGLIKAVMSAAGSTLADQWLEYFYCDSMDNTTLIQRGKKQVTKGSNTKGNVNIISNGSGFAVNEGQALLIIEDGKIIEFSTEPGRFTWDSSSEPSLFDNGMEGLNASFSTFGKRITYGGDAGKDQRVYYVNLKEIMDNKFGTSSPMPYNDPMYRSIYIRYFGTYSFKITDPIVFFHNVSGNVDTVFTKKQLMEQCDGEFITALDTAIARCSDSEYSFTSLPKYQRKLAGFMNDTLDEEWKQRRGMEIESVAIIKVTPDDESRGRIQKIDDSIMMSDPRVAAGRLVDAQANAMERAADNEAGAMNGFFGMNMAMQNGSALNPMFENLKVQDDNPLFKDSSNKDKWTCACGAENIGKFCSECGKERVDKTEWTCACGAVNKGKFCSECGKPHMSKKIICSNPECGYESTEDVKFCPQCGSPRK